MLYLTYLLQVCKRYKMNIFQLIILKIIPSVSLSICVIFNILINNYFQEKLGCNLTEILKIKSSHIPTIQVIVISSEALNLSELQGKLYHSCKLPHQTKCLVLTNMDLARSTCALVIFEEYVRLFSIYDLKKIITYIQT